MRKKFNNIISIVTPSFNQGRFLEQTINSVITQEGDFYIDYIVADGGSTDNSVAILRKYDDWIKSKEFTFHCRGIEFSWWSQKDNGQSEALNHAFGRAKGDIFAWINSDDYYNHSGVFQTVMDIFLTHSDVDLIHGSGREKCICNVVEINSDILLKRGCVIFQPSTFFTKKIFYDAGAINENLHYAFDLDLWIRIVQKAKCLKVDDVLSNFREWENSKSITSIKDFIREEKLIARKYGGNVINIRSIHKLRQWAIFDWFKKYFPFFYKTGSRYFYYLIDHFKY
jgi:glycosyltransferase involved in cell wall biosynthesis